MYNLEDKISSYYSGTDQVVTGIFLPVVSCEKTNKVISLPSPPRHHHHGPFHLSALFNLKRSARYQVWREVWGLELVRSRIFRVTEIKSNLDPQAKEREGRHRAVLREKHISE